MKLISALLLLLPWLSAYAAPAADVNTLAACDPAQVVVRKEWGDLPPSARKAYTDAVLCLQSQPSQLSHALYNTTSRYEDFVAVHINQTRFIHVNGVFLAWHRGFIQIFERALQRECGYAGTLPYWDWIKHHEDITASPLFDGSEYSLSGQGLPLTPEEKELEPDCWQLGNYSCPKGSGGGCVVDGPFKNYQIGYLPVGGNILTDPNPGLPPTVFNYVPRCFTRDINQYIATHFQTPENLYNLLNQTTIAAFQATLDNDSGVGPPGLHAAGHFATGSVGGDIFSSPTEPAFWLHHGMIDRVWAQWQTVDPARRVLGDNALSGTVTTNNIPPSEDATFDTLVDWGPLGGARPLRELMAVGFGDMCFEYE